MNILCTICSDLINQAENIYVTKCGHIFHHHCLAQWIERSKTCPQCRNKVTERCMFRLYPTISNENTGDDAATLQSRLDNAQLELRQRNTMFKEVEEKMAAVKADMKKQEDLIKLYEKKVVTIESKLGAVREQLVYANIQSKQTDKFREENENLKSNLQMLNGLQTVLNATGQEVEQMLKGYSDVRTLATFATALKRALSESESKRNETRDRLHATKQQLGLEKKNIADLQAKVVRLEDDLAHTKQEYEKLKREGSSDVKKEKTLKEINKTMSRPSISPPIVDLDSAVVASDGNNSFNTMLKKIENADSPYLSLKQSSVLSLSVLQLHPVNIADSRLKPSEIVLMNAIKKKPGNENKPSTSIFHTKDAIKLGSFDDSLELNNLDLSYDGLGGHSKLDTFPVPRPPVKSCIPKLSAKHKLKRPSGTQDIEKMLKRFKDK